MCLIYKIRFLSFRGDQFWFGRRCKSGVLFTRRVRVLRILTSLALLFQVNAERLGEFSSKKFMGLDSFRTGRRMSSLTRGCCGTKAGRFGGNQRSNTTIAVASLATAAGAGSATISLSSWRLRRRAWLSV